MQKKTKPGTLAVSSVLSCLQASLYVAALLDGTLDESRQHTLSLHINDCHSCKRTLLTAYAHRQQTIAEGSEATESDRQLPPWLVLTLAEEARKRV
jgi:predicted anti-sigma-YlaC factor YlaD